MKQTERHKAGFSRAIRCLAVGAAVATMAAACGSSSKKSSTTGTTAAGGGGAATASAPGVSANGISIGSHQPLTGPVAPGYSEIAPAAKAMFAYVNAKGGVFGRSINYTYEDDGYNPANTVTVIRKQILQDNDFAIFNGLGTPTHEQVQAFLNTEKVPDLFVASGNTGWNDTSKFPYTTGFQPNYAIEGRILGKYIHDTYGGQKVGYLLQNDDVGQGGKAGLDKEITAGDIVSKQSYAVSALASGGLGNQLAALQASGAKVVAAFAVPAAFAFALLAANQIGYHPTWVVSSIDASVSTLAGLLQGLSKGKAGAALLEGVVTASYLPSDSDTSNPWIQLFKKIHDQYDADKPFDANTVYGMSVAYYFVQLLQNAGKTLTRKGLLDATNKANLTGPGLLPLTFTASDHRGFEGEQIAKFEGGQVKLSGPVFMATETGTIGTYTKPQAPPPAGF